jgi:hypothetical protein
MGLPVSFQNNTHQIDATQLLIGIKECFEEEVKLKCAAFSYILDVLKSVMEKTDQNYTMTSFLGDGKIWGSQELMKLTNVSLASISNEDLSTEVYKRVAEHYCNVVLPMISQL